jgi:hypothetical protein
MPDEFARKSQLAQKIVGAFKRHSPEPERPVVFLGISNLVRI